MAGLSGRLLPARFIATEFWCMSSWKSCIKHYRSPCQKPVRRPLSRIWVLGGERERDHALPVGKAKWARVTKKNTRCAFCHLGHSPITFTCFKPVILTTGSLWNYFLLSLVWVLLTVFLWPNHGSSLLYAIIAQDSASQWPRYGVPASASGWPSGRNRNTSSVGFASNTKQFWSSWGMTEEPEKGKCVSMKNTSNGNFQTVAYIGPLGPRADWDNCYQMATSHSAASSTE